MASRITPPFPRYSIYSLQAKVFRGFTDPARLMMLEALVTEPRTVGELATIAGLSQSATSNHLACLLDCGLVTRERRGKYGIYSLADERIPRLLSLTNEMLSDHAAQIAACTHMDAPPEAH